jgi:hypothetical protein
MPARPSGPSSSSRRACARCSRPTGSASSSALGAALRGDVLLLLGPRPAPARRGDRDLRGRPPRHHHPVGPDPQGEGRAAALGGVLAGLVGALVIIRPGTDVFQPAALLPLAAATCFAGYSIATRFLGQDESPFTSLLYTTLIGTVVATIAMPFFWTTPATGDAVVMATFGAIGMVGQLFLILALGYAPASLIAPFGYMALAFNATWGFLFFAEVPDRWTVAGASIIVGAGLYVWYREMRIKARSTALPSARADAR